MGTILNFRHDADRKGRPAFRERRVQAGSSAEIVIFPGVRIEREEKRSTKVEADVGSRASDATSQKSNG